MTYSITQLSSEVPFGKVIRGLKQNDIEDPNTRDALHRLWIEDGVVVFTDTEIDEDFHLELSRVFGPLEYHPTREFQTEGKPELITIVASPGDDRTEIEMDGERGEFLGWHKDLVYVDKINHGGILRALQPTSRGGLTGFIDQVDAYKRLPEALKQRVERLHVIYQISPHDEQPYASPSKVTIIKQSEKTKALFRRRYTDFPPISHPLVYVHPETHHKVLNFSPGHAISVQELPAAEGRELLQTLANHIFGCPAYHHKWTQNEMVLWDNWRMLHMVSLIPLDEPRIMQRTTIAGDYGLGKKLPFSAAAMRVALPS